MKINCEVISDIGSVRDNNEDMASINGITIRDESHESMVKMDNRPRFSAIVADGMGGYGGGEIASEFAVKSFDDFLLNLPGGLEEIDFRIALNKWFESLQSAMIQRQSQPGLAQMGTTLTGIFTYDDRDYMINIGDSRVYRWRGGILNQMTTDHSERERLGDPTIASNLIYNAIGAPNAFIDVTELSYSSPIIDDDKYIICSDGLSDMISNDTIKQILSEGGSARQLVDAAIEAGGSDNCTVILLHVIDREEDLDNN